MQIKNSNCQVNCLVKARQQVAGESHCGGSKWTLNEDVEMNSWLLPWAPQGFEDDMTLKMQTESEQLDR